MDDLIKREVEAGLSNIKNRYTGEVKNKVAEIILDVNTVLSNMITDPENAAKHSGNLDILYGNLSTIAGIEKKALRKEVAKIVTGVLTKSITGIVIEL